MKSASIFGAICATVVLGAATQSLANSSAYSDLDLDACQTIEEDNMGGTYKCGGYKDYPIYFKEGDLRQSMAYGHVAQILIDEGFQSFGAFNHVNTKIEWRLDANGMPIAAILRWFIENSNPETGAVDDASRGQVLVISRVAGQNDGMSCVVGYVDALANKNANELARQIADQEARYFACGLDEAFWWGERGPKSSEPMSYLPDAIKVE